MRLFRLISLLVLAATIGIKVRGLPPDKTGFLAVNGIIVDGMNGEALVGVKVLVVDRDYLTSTGENGMYEITCEPGKHTLRFLMEGYRNHDEYITVNSGNLTVNVALRPVELELLPSMKIAASPITIFSRENNRESTITVVVKNSDGTPVVGVRVAFKCTSTCPGYVIVGRFDCQTAVTDQNGVAKVEWTCKGEEAVERLNAWNAMRFFYFVYVSASCSVDGRSIGDMVSIVVQKESCHYYC